MNIAPDLAVEILSPVDNMIPIVDRVKLFGSAGTRLFWVVDPKLRSVVSYRPGGTVTKMQSEDILTGEDVVPGFTLKIAELFEE